MTEKDRTEEARVRLAAELTCLLEQDVKNAMGALSSWFWHHARACDTCVVGGPSCEKRKKVAQAVDLIFEASK